MKKIFTILIFVVSLNAYGQQDPLFSQYMFNKLLVNPAYAGSRELLTVDLLDRYQWIGIDGAPRTITLAAHTVTRNKKIGLGAYIFRDVIGPTVNQGFMATYAYRIRTQRGRLSLGLQFGFKYFDFDWDALHAKDADYLLYPQDLQKFSPDANFGIYYQSKKAFWGLSSKQLLQNEYALGTYDGRSTYSRLMRHFYAMAGFQVPLDNKITFRPSALVKYVQNAPVQVDLNASVLFNNIFWLGASFRTEKAVVFLTEIRISPKMRLGYSFDLYLNELQLHNRGSHEFRLGFDINLDRSRMMTPRFF